MKKIIREETRVLEKETGEIIINPAVVEEVPDEDAANYNTIEGYEPIHWKTPWNHNRDAVSLHTALECRDPTKTQQHLAADQDINNILAKFTQTGQPPPMTQARYTDIETLEDLQDIMITQHQVNEAWDKLPQAAKQLLGDPGRFAAYVERALETGDVDALRRVDLVKPEPPPPATPTGGTPAPVPPAPPPQGADK